MIMKPEMLLLLSCARPEMKDICLISHRRFSFVPSNSPARSNETAGSMEPAATTGALAYSTR